MADLLRVFPEMVIEIDRGIKDQTVLRHVEGNKYKLTDLGIYIILSQGAKVFREALNHKDQEYKYTVLSKEKEVKDPDKVKEIYDQYKDLRKEMERRINVWREQNADAFIDTYVIPNVSKYCSKELNLLFHHKPDDVDAAFYAFKSFDLNLKDFMDRKKKSLMTSKRKIISPEYSSDYKKVQEDIRKELGIPTMDEIKDMVQDTVIVQTQSLRRSLIDHNDLPINVKTDGLEYAIMYGQELINNFKNVSSFAEEDEEDEVE